MINNHPLEVLLDGLGCPKEVIQRPWLPKDSLPYLTRWVIKGELGSSKPAISAE